jgi:D-aminopeptidase
MIERIRAREFGIELGTMQTGRYNAITDVKGVGVGHHTMINGDSVRTGVTTIIPHQGNPYYEKITAAVDVFNGYGKSTGLSQIMFEGVIETPIILTETLNTWRVADAVLDYMREGYGTTPPSLNVVVGETNGGYLTENFDRRILKKQVFEALDIARSEEGQGTVLEGNVGGGTPMTGYGFKGGIGTASRVFANFTVGALVQLNCGRKDSLKIDGVPVGRKIKLPNSPAIRTENSIMMVVATDLSMESRQLWKVAKRAALGLARTGSYGGNTSGDFTIAFTTGKETVEDLTKVAPDTQRTFWSYENFLNLVYRATVEAVEEAIINALFKAETMVGREGNTRYELPYDQVEEIFKNHGRTLNNHK